MKKINSFKSQVLALTVLLFMGMSGILCAEKIAIIDAGSSGSRLFVYDIDVNSYEKIKLVYPIGKAQKKASKGRALSSIADHTDSVKVFLQQMTQNYPCESIDLYIFATAGMRLKPKAQADAIYEKLKDQPRVNGYQVREAMTISGQYEGLYGWLAANYENGHLGFSTSSTKPSLTYTSTPTGILEIGGASLQIAFTTKANHEQCLTRPGLGNIYCRSILGGGVDQIYKNTKPGRKYKFHLDLGEDVSDLYPADAQFMGLGIPVNNVIKGLKEQNHKRTYKGKIKAYVRSLDDFQDTPQNYHPRINAHYIKWLSHGLELDGKLIEPNKDSSWTLGAALDIAINDEVPVAFDHDKVN